MFIIEDGNIQYYYSYYVQPAHLLLNQLLAPLYRCQLFVCIYENLRQHLAHLKGIRDDFRLLISLSHNEYLFFNKVDGHLLHSYPKC